MNNARHFEPLLPLEDLLFTLALSGPETSAALLLHRGSQLGLGLMRELRTARGTLIWGLAQSNSGECFSEPGGRLLQALEAARRGIAEPTDILGDLVRGAKLGVEDKAGTWSL